jgi:hypothetical protein
LESRGGGVEGKGEAGEDAVVQGGVRDDDWRGGRCGGGFWSGHDSPIG